VVAGRTLVQADHENGGPGHRRQTLQRHDGVLRWSPVRGHARDLDWAACTNDMCSSWRKQADPEAGGDYRSLGTQIPMIHCWGQSHTSRQALDLFRNLWSMIAQKASTDLEESMPSRPRINERLRRRQRGPGRSSTHPAPGLRRSPNPWAPQGFGVRSPTTYVSASSGSASAPGALNAVVDDLMREPR
jgi:hypothetical protein